MRERESELEAQVGGCARQQRRTSKSEGFRDWLVIALMNRNTGFIVCVVC